ncbi:MAG: pyrroline-5-carboxylate reductase [Planctomycetaceae bacterium]|jgi:pyrroline-5-carboxylate reductase|nr:pyrroline-5-carboxylate reductase [Planctomycetaceae bacterium]
MTQSGNLNVGFIGAGRMATALAQGLVSAGFVSADRVVATDVLPAALDAFAKQTSARVVESASEVVIGSDVLFLAVKPQQMSQVLNGLSSLLEDRHLIISIAAGLPLSVYESALGTNRRIVRVMPNTPCLVSECAAGFSTGGSTSAEDSKLVEAMLATVGVAIQVDEKLLDAVTGLSGSGPAYAYQIIEALSDGAVHMGLPRDIATKLAAQTLLGAAKMVLETGQHPGTLKDAVTSPGGTTIAGVHALESGGLRGTIMNAVQAATDRSKELGAI